MQDAAERPANIVNTVDCGNDGCSEDRAVCKVE